MDIEEQKSGSYHFPKLSHFFGEEGKGDVTYAAYRYEVESLLTHKVFTEEQILLGIRRSVKGTANDIVRRLGTSVTVRDILKKLDSTYGSIESQESILRKFFSCTQGKDTVNAYASRLEELHAQAIELKAIDRSSDDLLKQVLYQRLDTELKHTAQYKYETIKDYDRFKIELRKFEADLHKPVPKTCHAAQKVPEDELSSLKSTVKLLEEKINQLQKDKDTTYPPPQQYYVSNRRYSRSTGRFRGRGRGNYVPRRPIAGNAFRGACHNCGQNGHYARDCQEDTLQREQQVTCHRCGEEGHIARRCPKNYRNTRGQNLN